MTDIFFSFSFRRRNAKNVSSNFAIFEVKRKLSESDHDFHRRMIAKIIISNAKHGILHFDENKFERLPYKQIELQITDKILKNVLIHLEKHIILHRMGEGNAALISVQFTAAQFKNIQMKTSSLPVAIIEAALTMIIDRLNDENLANDEPYVALKQVPVSFSYTHNSQLYAKGVRVFKMKKKRCQSDC
jgi:hypothetical protein